MLPSLAIRKESGEREKRWNIYVIPAGTFIEMQTMAKLEMGDSVYKQLPFWGEGCQSKVT